MSSVAAQGIPSTEMDSRTNSVFTSYRGGSRRGGRTSRGHFRGKRDQSSPKEANALESTEKTQGFRIKSKRSEKSVEEEKKPAAREEKNADGWITVPVKPAKKPPAKETSPKATSMPQSREAQTKPRNKGLKKSGNRHGSDRKVKNPAALGNNSTDASQKVMRTNVPLPAPPLAPASALQAVSEQTAFGWRNGDSKPSMSPFANKQSASGKGNRENKQIKPSADNGNENPAFSRKDKFGDVIPRVPPVTQDTRNRKQERRISSKPPPVPPKTVTLMLSAEASPITPVMPTELDIARLFQKLGCFGFTTAERSSRIFLSFNNDSKASAKAFLASLAASLKVKRVQNSDSHNDIYSVPIKLRPWNLTVAHDQKRPPRTLLAEEYPEEESIIDVVRQRRKLSMNVDVVSMPRPEDIKLPDGLSDQPDSPRWVSDRQGGNEHLVERPRDVQVRALYTRKGAFPVRRSRGPSEMSGPSNPPSNSPGIKPVDPPAAASWPKAQPALPKKPMRKAFVEEDDINWADDSETDEDGGMVPESTDKVTQPDDVAEKAQNAIIERLGDSAKQEVAKPQLQWRSQLKASSNGAVGASSWREQSSKPDLEPLGWSQPRQRKDSRASRGRAKTWKKMEMR